MSRRSFVASTAGALSLAGAGAALAQAKPKMRFSAAFPDTDLRAEGYKALAGLRGVPGHQLPYCPKPSPPSAA